MTPRGEGQSDLWTLTLLLRLWTYQKNTSCLPSFECAIPPTTSIRSCCGIKSYSNGSFNSLVLHFRICKLVMTEARWWLKETRVYWRGFPRRDFDLPGVRSRDELLSHSSPCMISIVFDIRHFVLSVQAETLIYQSTYLVSMEKEKHKKKKSKRYLYLHKMYTCWLCNYFVEEMFHPTV